jgi:hypothetical protein
MRWGKEQGGRGKTTDERRRTKGDRFTLAIFDYRLTIGACRSLIPANVDRFSNTDRRFKRGRRWIIRNIQGILLSNREEEMP